MKSRNIFTQPFIQALLLILIQFCLLLIFDHSSKEHLWMIGGGVYALFILVNVLAFFWSNDRWLYFLVSIVASIVFTLISWMTVQFTAWLFAPAGSDEGAMIFLIIIYHPFALLVAMLLKWIAGRLSR